MAFEIDPDLADRAKRNLAIYTQVEVRSGDATPPFKLPSVDAIVACAGATHVPAHWLESLAVGGHMMLPLTASNHKGFMMLLNRQADGIKASSLGSCGFYHCVGARKETEEHALQEALNAHGGKAPELGSLHLVFPAPGNRTTLGMWEKATGSRIGNRDPSRRSVAHLTRPDRLRRASEAVREKSPQRRSPRSEGRCPERS